MKNVLIVVFALMSVGLFAQRDQRGKQRNQQRMERAELTPEQQASLHSKRLALELDLSEAQQEKIYQLDLAQAKEREVFREENRSKKEGQQANRFKRQERRLERQLAYKKSLKPILTEPQMKKWETLQSNRERKFRDKRRSGHQKRQH